MPLCINFLELYFLIKSFSSSFKCSPFATLDKFCVANLKAMPVRGSFKIPIIVPKDPPIPIDIKRDAMTYSCGVGFGSCFLGFSSDFSPSFFIALLARKPLIPPLA